MTNFIYLRGNSITSLCETRVLIFGGYKKTKTNGHFKKSWNKKLWLFDGESEEWTTAKNVKNAPTARHHHRAFTQLRKESKCKCKMSMFVYGGLSESYNKQLDDFWELQCVDDQRMKYQWIKLLDLGRQKPSLARLRAFSVHNKEIRWIEYSIKRTYNLNFTKKKRWYSKIIKNACPKKVHFSAREDMVYDEEHQLLIFHLQRSFLGVYDVNKNQFYCLEINVEPRMKILVPAKILLVHKEILLVSLQPPDANAKAQIKISTLRKDEFRKLLTNNHALSKANFQEITPRKKYPLFNGNARLARISDAVWYLILEEDQKVQMWRFEKNYPRWTLYDPDQGPPADTSFLAYSAFKNNYVAILGSDRLWIYSANSRIWTKIHYLGSGPNKLTSYATMNSMNNGSLVLFGGIDHKSTSLWMAAVDLKGMKVTWKRLCCDGGERKQEPPTRQLQRCSSALWNNTFYVFFLNTKSSCKWKTYHTRLGVGNLKWKVTSIRNKTEPVGSSLSKHFCSRPSTLIERFAVTVGVSGDLLIEDLGQTKLKMINMTNVVSVPGEKSLLFSDATTLFRFIARWDTSRKKTAVVGLESFQFPECKHGTSSPDYPRYPCRPCPEGQYNDHYGATTCTDCPTGLVTRTTGSTSIKNCTSPVKKCANGICIVQSDYTTMCICNAGFTGKLCDIPTTYLIAIGTVLTLLLIAAFLYCIKRVKQHKNVASYTRAEIAEETVAELFDIWSVDESEVDFDRMIGQGSFGDVWTAQYREQTVAVKVLKIRDEDCTNEQLQEFKDEGELLRSIFHAHIVRFIGTGKTADNKPFIVLEYMERGSVRKELDDKYADHPMEIELQVKYALHAAKGMRHLHRVNRMHRDLKCDNLLVNSQGIVKVADLGCTRIAP